MYELMYSCTLNFNTPICLLTYHHYLIIEPRVEPIYLVYLAYIAYSLLCRYVAQNVR